LVLSAVGDDMVVEIKMKIFISANARYFI